MDLPSAYWHVHMEKSLTPKTAFEDPPRKYEMLRMPFGLRNSQATQQRLMDQVLNGVTDTSTYVDNILSHSTHFDEHLATLKEIFERLHQGNLNLRLDKSEFAREEVEQFGFTIDAMGLRPTDNGIVKLNQYPRPTSMKEVKRFLGMANYYQGVCSQIF